MIAAPAAGGPTSAGALVLHPLVVAALVALVANDHVAKARWPGTITGKASDVAGMVLAPAVLAAVAVGAGDRVRRPLPLVPVVAASAAFVALGFAAVKLTAAGADAYAVGLGVGQWPVRAAAALVGGRPVPGVVAVDVVRDPTDLVVVPFVALPLLLTGWRPGRTG